MGNLLIKAAQQLLAHQLRADLALRLVGNHVIREEMGAFHSVFIKLIEKLLQTVSLSGRNGNDGIKVAGGTVYRNDLQKLFLLYGVNLIYDKNGGHVNLLYAGNERLLLRADIGDRLNKQKHRIHVCHTLLDNIHHIIAKAGLWIVETRGIHQHKLSLAPADNGGDTVSCGLGLV